VSTGDMLREAQRAGTALGREVRTYLEDGGLVPDATMVGLVRERLSAADARDGFVLDGFPRTVGQAEALDDFLARRQQRLDGVVCLRVPHEDLIARIAGRRVCRQCGTMYHVLFDPPPQSGVCGRCGGELYQREDDREETVRHRLEVYERETDPVVRHYRAAGLLRETDGRGAVEEVFDRVAASVR
jgi:adenylate kinase